MRNVLTLGLAVLLVLATGCSFIDRATGMSEVRTLRGIGTPAAAEILRVWETGVRVMDKPVIGMEVEVHPTEGDPFIATIRRTWVAEIDLPRFQPGEVIPVRYDPLKPTRVAVDADPPADPDGVSEPQP